MQRVDQAVNGLGRVLLGGGSQLSVACRGGGAGVPEQDLYMAKTQTAFKQVCGPGMTKRMGRNLFFIPHSATSALTAAWVPPRFMWVVARRMRSREPTALGNSKRG